MRKRNRFDDIFLFPFTQEFKGYSMEGFSRDMGAGLSVALLTIPQAMAFALVADLPLSCGLFAAIFSTIIAAIFGSSRHLITGPSNSIAILLQAGTAQILFNYYRDLHGMERDMMALQIMTQMTLLVGAIQALVAFFKLGRLSQFVSHSVIVGYITGATIAIVINQLFVFLGIHELHGLNSFFEKGFYLISHLHKIHWPTAIVGLGSLFLLIGFRRVNPKVPAAVISFAFSGWIVYMIGMSSLSIHTVLEVPVTVVGNTGDISGGLPPMALPYFNLKIMNALLPVAFAVAMLSILESVSISKALAANSGQRLSVNQDIFGLSLGNLASSLIGAMPVSGSSSRSTLSYNYGAQTRLAAVFSGICLAFILYVFGFLVNHIPLPALAALLLLNAAKTVNVRHLFLCLKATSSDAFVFWITLFSCIFFSLDVAFYIGVALSVTFYLKKAAAPQLAQYGVEPDGKLRNMPLNAARENLTIRVIKVKGELFFGAADLFQSTLKAMAEDDDTTRVIILELKHARDLDATACLALQQLNDYLRSSDRMLVCCSLTLQTWDVLSNAGMVDELGRENLFLLDEQRPQVSLQKALERAEEIVAEEPSEEEREEGKIEVLTGINIDLGDTEEVEGATIQ